jgi:hypothetical protein
MSDTWTSRWMPVTTLAARVVGLWGGVWGGWKISISLARRRFPLEKILNVAVEICRLSAYLTAKRKVRYSSPFSPGTDKKWYSLPGTWYVWYLLVLLACWHTHNHCTCWYPLIKTPETSFETTIPARLLGTGLLKFWSSTRKCPFSAGSIIPTPSY